MRQNARVLALVFACMTFFSNYCFAGGQQDETINDDEIRVVNFVQLVYPHIWQTAHVQGVVVVLVKLNEQGKVTDAHAISGPKQLIHDSLDNAMKWTFEPNAKNAAILIYNFRIRDVCPGNNDWSHFAFERPNFSTITACAPIYNP